VITTTAAKPAELFWLSVYDPGTGSATRVIGSLAMRGTDFDVMLTTTSSADPWRDRIRTTAEEYFDDANGQTRGVIDAVVVLGNTAKRYTLIQLAALSNLAAIGNGAT